MHETRPLLCLCCATPLASDAIGCGECGVCVEPEAPDTGDPSAFALGSFVGLVGMLPVVAITMAQCRGGCSSANEVLVMLMVLVEAALSLYAVWRARRACGTQRVLSFALCLPGALVAVPLSAWITLGLMQVAAKALGNVLA